MKLFLVICGSAALYCALRSALAIWRPRNRGSWGGPFTGRSSKNDPERMPVGAVAHIGIAIICAGFAVSCFLSLFDSAPAKTPANGVVPRILISWILAGFWLMMIGWFLDSRAHDATRREHAAVGERPFMPEQRLRWIPIVGGTVIILLILFALIFLK